MRMSLLLNKQFKVIDEDGCITLHKIYKNHNGIEILASSIHKGRYEAHVVGELTLEELFDNIRVVKKEINKFKSKWKSINRYKDASYEELMMCKEMFEYLGDQEELKVLEKQLAKKTAFQ